MQHSKLTFALGAVALVALYAEPARAADEPVDGKRILIKDTGLGRRQAPRVQRHR